MAAAVWVFRSEMNVARDVIRAECYKHGSLAPMGNSRTEHARLLKNRYSR